MRLFSEKVSATLTNSSLNIIQVENFKEIFFGVYEIEINKNKYPVEKISEHDGNPVVCIPVEVKGVKSNYPFVLTKGKLNVIFNENIDSIGAFEVPAPEQVEEAVEIDELAFEETVHIDLDQKNKILKEIKIAKEQALISANKDIEKNRRSQMRALKEESDKKQQALDAMLKSSREDLVNEFVNISNKIKSDVIEKNEDRFSEIKETIDNKIQDLADTLSESLNRDFENSSKLFDDSIKTLVEELYKTKITPKVNKELTDIASDIVEKVAEIDKNLIGKLSEKADLNLIESVHKDIDSIRDANVELNNSINKGVQKALSRVGNVDKKIIDIAEQIELKIEQSERDVSEYFNDRLKLVEEKTLDITDEARSYFLNMIQESRDNLLSEIRQLKNEKPVEYIIEAKSGDKISKDWSSIEKEWNKKIHDKFETYKTDLRKYVAVYSSGGGTNATQYQDGGTMNGNLTVVGAISANQYLGLNLPFGDYLPLSGGTLTGDLIVNGHDIRTRTLSADSIKFNTSTAVTAGVGQLTWNDTDGTLDLGLKGGNVTLQVGQEQVVRVVNKTNANLLESEYKVVRVRLASEGGAQGQRLAVVLAQGNNDPDSVTTLGVVTENIDNNQEGFITTFGHVRNINTTGSLQGENWVEGDVLYLSPTVAGGLTKVKPQAPQHSVTVAYVEYVHQNHGKLFIKIDNGYEIDELHNVRITSVSGNDVLKYNSSVGVWENSNTLSLSSLSATRIFTNQLDALSANITVIDIKQYELSGFNVQGNATVQGSISASQTVYANGAKLAAENFAVAMAIALG